MGIEGSFKLFVKNGDYGYKANGNYGVKDYVAEYDLFADGLKDFLEWSEDSDTKVVLTFKPKKSKGKKA